MLQEDFYSKSTRHVARQLLGKTLVRRLEDQTELRCTIVEVEAYLAARDPASHSRCGTTRRNASMFGAPGHLYVYTIHTRHCMNIVTEPEGQGAAVLIRAVEPECGIEEMWQARFAESSPESPSAQQLTRLTQGPGRLCQAMQVDLSQDGIELLDKRSTVWLEEPRPEVYSTRWKIRQSPRIGISQGQSLPLRYFVDGNRFVSGCAREHSEGRNWTFFHDAAAKE
ncbi:MAG: DNA-3-methyladenine glycosylase [Planctomycetota bacterium]